MLFETSHPRRQMDGLLVVFKHCFLATETLIQITSSRYKTGFTISSCRGGGGGGGGLEPAPNAKHGINPWPAQLTAGTSEDPLGHLVIGNDPVPIHGLFTMHGMPLVGGFCLILNVPPFQRR